MSEKKGGGPKSSGPVDAVIGNRYFPLAAVIAAILIVFRGLSLFFEVTISFQGQLLLCAVLALCYLLANPPGFIKKHNLAVSLLVVVLIFFLGLQVRMATVNEEATYGSGLTSAMEFIGLTVSDTDEKYLLAADPHFWYVQTERVLDGIEGRETPEYDYLRLHPEYQPYEPHLFARIAAYSYKIAHSITGIEFYRFLFWFPAIVAALSAFPAFWIGRELYSNLAGIFASFFIVFSPSFMSRSIGGFFDTDCAVIFCSVLVVAFFLAAYNRVDPKNWKKPSPIILSALAGASLALFAIIWSGFAYMPWLFAGLFGLHWMYRVYIAEGKDIKEKLRHSWLFFRSHALVYVVMGIAFLILTLPSQGILPAKQVIDVTTFFQEAKAEGGIFPNVWISISEEMSASSGEVIARAGHLAFGLGLIGLVLLLVMFLQNFGKKSIYPETFFLMIIWIIPTLYGSIWAFRFVQLLAIPLAICAGIALGMETPQAE
ncbi:MAG: STT3 domain-containing protein, partial [Candidatus Aenigmatarchaeota archaeon]